MYVLDKKYHKFKSNNVLEILGYPVRIAKHNIIVYNQEIIDILIKEKILPEFNHLVKKIIVFIEEDPDGDTAVLFLDELAKLYALYLNKYEKYLSKSEKEKFMRDLRLLTNELKGIIHNKVKHSTIAKSGRRR